MWMRRNVSPMVVVAGLVLLGVGALACTPLGGWLYSDPTFALSGVRTKYRGAPADTLQLILVGCNLNDFDLDGLTLEGHLIVNDMPVGVFQSDRSFAMKMRDSVELMVALEMPRASEPPVHAKGDDMLTAKYELNGKVDVSTPIGVRRVAIHQLGDVRFDSAGQTSGWTVRNARLCRPGMSMLPGQSGKPRVIVDTMFRPDAPTIGAPNPRDGI